MNILKFLDTLDVSDKKSEEYANLADRRTAMMKMSKWGRNLALASLPLSITEVFASPSISADKVTDALNFALTLEYLEDEFYRMGLNTGGLIDGSDLPTFQQISKHETAHVQFLTDTINAFGDTPVSKPNFDFTAGGAFNPFGAYADFLALAQAFEDTGVRAYKGQAGEVMSSDAALTAALQIHSVEARHAAQVRRLRTKKGMGTDLGWITGESRGNLPSQTQPVYDGEGNTTHLGIDVPAISNIGTDAITQAWDEPLTKTQVLTVANLFIM